MFDSPKFEDDPETRLLKNVTHVLAGNTAETAIAVLIKVLVSLLVGVSADKGKAVKYVGDISRHLKKELNKKNENEFAYLEKDENNQPIIYDK